MEGLRGFAVFLVFLVHYVTVIKPWIAGESALVAFAGALNLIGNTGVDLFFVLSGYLIYGSLISRPQPFFRYMSRRVVRIYPAFLAVFLLYVALSYAFPAENKIPRPFSNGLIYIVENLFLLPGLFFSQPIISVAWSLSYEMFFYVVVPLVITLFRLRHRSTLWRVTFFTIVAALIAVYCAAYGGPVRLIMFLSGILLHEAMNNRRIPSPNSAVGLLALVLGLMAILLLSMAGFNGKAPKACILFVSLFVLCLACFRDQLAWLPRALSWTPLRWLGNISYSYYLLHGLTLKAAFLALAVVLPASHYGPWLFWTLLPAAFALTLVPATVLFLVVERPYSLGSGVPKCTAEMWPHQYASVNAAHTSS